MLTKVQLYQKQLVINLTLISKQLHVLKISRLNVAQKQIVENILDTLRNIK